LFSRYIALHDTNTLKTQRIETHLATHQSEYSLILKKGETASGKWCELVGCKAESEFNSNNAGWAIYERVVA